MFKGYDLSVLQGFPDFQQVASNGVSFIIHRCGVGNSGIDSNYSKNIAAAKAAGLLVACYHFIYPLPPNPADPLRDPIKQANYHWNAAGGELAFFDAEWPAQQDFSKWNVTPQSINQWMIAYAAEYTRLDGGRKIGIYTYPYWAAVVKIDPILTQYPLWIASYEPTPAVPAPFTNWVLWQNTGGTGPNAGHLPSGVPVDTNFAKDLSLWQSATVAPPPDPTPAPVLESPPQESDIPVAPAPVVLISPPSNIFNTIVSAITNFFK